MKFTFQRLKVHSVHKVKLYCQDLLKVYWQTIVFSHNLLLKFDTKVL